MTGFNRNFGESSAKKCLGKYRWMNGCHAASSAHKNEVTFVSKRCMVEHMEFTLVSLKKKDKRFSNFL